MVTNPTTTMEVVDTGEKRDGCGRRIPPSGRRKELVARGGRAGWHGPHSRGGKGLTTRCSVRGCSRVGPRTSDLGGQGALCRGRRGRGGSRAGAGGAIAGRLDRARSKYAGCGGNHATAVGLKRDAGVSVLDPDLRGGGAGGHAQAIRRAVNGSAAVVG